MKFNKFKKSLSQQALQGQTHLLTHVYDAGEILVKPGFKERPDYYVHKLILCSVWKKFDKKTKRSQSVFEQKILDITLYKDSDLWKILLALGNEEEQLDSVSNAHKDAEDRTELAHQVLQDLTEKLHHYFCIGYDWLNHKKIQHFAYLGEAVSSDIKFWAVGIEKAMKMEVHWTSRVYKMLLNAGCISDNTIFVDMGAFRIEANVLPFQSCIDSTSSVDSTSMVEPESEVVLDSTSLDLDNVSKF